MYVDAQPDPVLYPFTSRWFNSKAGRVHYVDEGVGRPILFCHGSPTWSFLYRNVIVDLRPRFRCIAVDNLGFGLSERPDGFSYRIDEHIEVLGKLIDRLELDDYVVVGHDWGGPIGLGASIGRADRVHGVALTNTLFWPVDKLLNRAFSAVMSTEPMQRQILNRNLLVERFLLRELRSTISKTEADQYRAVQPSPDARVGLAATPAQIRDARPLLADLFTQVRSELGHKPALAAWGAKDPVFRPADCLPRVSETFSDVRTIEFPDAGHFVTESAPTEIADAIAQRFG